MEYKILVCTQKTSETREEVIVRLEFLVQDYLDEGWIPKGGIACDRGSFYQAIVREKKEN